MVDSDCSLSFELTKFNQFKKQTKIQTNMVLNEKFIIPSARELFRLSMKRKDWNNLTPLQKWCYLYGIGRAGLEPVGYRAFSDDQILQWNSYLIVSFMVFYAIFATYTAVYYTSRGEIVKWLPCTILMIILIAVGFFMRITSIVIYQIM